VRKLFPNWKETNEKSWIYSLGKKKTLHKYNKKAAAAENFQSVTVLLSLSPTLYFLCSSYPKLFF
jgi:hypothetical protein